MSNIILSGNQIKALETKAEELSAKPTEFRNSIEVFNNILSNTQMAKWIQETSSANSVAVSLRKDIETLNLVISLFNDIINEAQNITAWNIENNNKVVKDVALGNYGNGQIRKDSLTNAGYDYAYIQNQVNEQVGSSFRHPESNA